MPKKPGPKPAPSNVVALRGGSQADVDRRAAEEVKPHPVSPKRPGDLSPLERECWDQHAPELDRLGLLTVIDAAAFRMACQAYALAIAAWQSMRERKADGSIDNRKKSIEVVTPDTAHGGLRRHPGFLVWKQAQDAYRAWCSEFGLTPSSRVGLRPGAPIGSAADDDDDDEAFFGS